MSCTDDAESLDYGTKIEWRDTNVLLRTRLLPDRQRWNLLRWTPMEWNDSLLSKYYNKELILIHRFARFALDPAIEL